MPIKRLMYYARVVISSGRVTPASDEQRAMFDFVDAYDRAYEEAAAEHDLTVAQACVLGSIAEPRSMRELAEELRCDPSNITQIVDRLAARKLIRRKVGANDRRSRWLSRTAAGDALNTRFERSFEFARTASANLADDERRQLARLLRKALGRPHGDEAEVRAG